LPINLVVDPSGQFVYAANYNSGDISAYTVDAATGALTAVAGSPFGAGGNPHSIAID
jgi:6-phosphogluconolactonase (cycloisomerase 2 family)